MLWRLGAYDRVPRFECYYRPPRLFCLWLAVNVKAGSIGGESPSLLLPASPASEEEDEARASRLYEGHTASQGHRVVLASAVSNCLGS